MKTTLLKSTAAWPLVIFLLLPALTRAETAVQAWVQRYNGPGNSHDYATAVAVDGSNNVIVTGYSFDSGGYYFHYATIKYSSGGSRSGPTATTGRGTTLTNPPPWQWTAATTWS